jgi:hypothetical protein
MSSPIIMEANILFSHSMVGLPNYVDYLPIEPRMIFRIVNMEFGIFYLLKHTIFALAPCLRSILQPHPTQYSWLVKTINIIKLARYLEKQCRQFLTTGVLCHYVG